MIMDSCFFFVQKVEDITNEGYLLISGLLMNNPSM